MKSESSTNGIKSRKRPVNLFLGGVLSLTEQPEWAEPLPKDCPPSEAWEPNNEIYYRLVDNPPTAKNFVSNRVLQPQRELKNVSECEARGLSVYDDIEGCHELMETFLPLRKKQVAKVTLPPECGKVLQTLQNPSHHSWWLKSGFDPVSVCEIV